MRKTTLAVATILTALAAMSISEPASAYDYPYCLQGRGVGIPGDCSFQTYSQCEASASGRGLTCNINPRVAFQRQSRARAIHNY